MENTDVRQKLLELAGDRRVSLAALSRMIGKNASYLQQFVRKGSPRKLEEEDRGMLARFFGVDEVELGRSKENSFGGADVSFTPEWLDVPRVTVGASAGSGASSEGEDVCGTIRFAARWLRSMGLQAEMLSAIAVKGDSMEPTLRDGDEILVDRTPGPLRDGIHVVRLEDNLLVKRIDAGRPGLVVLLSDNSAYRPVECRAEDVQVIGRVVWKGGRI
ncbi:S24 family peptidase [Novosphingobium mangrovi (ex Huang et al. 2023)]|uniref:S24 family peptidase n=1 Tax=Novosphingobium mangrovi (ex Huang et al. 2023) TaxID=2976432 RepID=A0ABT2I3R5_9SPHN|nr:S24 family peptidase [Novosphingobium mangrovi (ex Huang et al. 2023)]MCT2399452.1 S24 family peptidase [Novosphingobium mangrovi (ex Huang et al. 2023)]